MKIHIETIPQDQHRYDTAGDYWQDPDGTYQVRVSRLSTQKREMALAIHEIWEMFLVIVQGISFEEIDRFDADFEMRQQVSDHPGPYREPGEDYTAPYHEEHQAATMAERSFLVGDLKDEWEDYEKEIEAL